MAEQSPNKEGTANSFDGGTVRTDNSFGLDTHAGGSSGTMYDMTRPYKEPPPPFPATKAHNDSLPTGGITMSHEASSAEGAAELNVLKAILNREGYLNRVEKSARTVHKKFKPEISDILDLIRAASLDVCESIVKWREVKKDHHAAFMWNNVNYLLKMPSDLDFLTQYLAIANYLGFGLYRNPFVIPAPLEMGAHLYADLILDPQGIDKTVSTTMEGAVIGGITQIKLRKTYTPSEQTKVKGAARYDRQEEEKRKKKNPYGAPNKNVLKEPPKVRLGGTPNSLVLNDDFRRIRQAELVVLKEEEKFGALSRDNEDRLMPILQAETAIAAVELMKDNRRPIEEPSHSVKYAPHAKNSDIGTKKDAWLPIKLPQNVNQNSELLTHTDQQADPSRRGEGKFGGQLAPITKKGVDTRMRKPIRSGVGSQMEFRRYRKKKMLSDRLEEIAQLKQSIEMQKESIKMMESRQNRRNSTRGSDDGGLTGAQSMPGTPGQQQQQRPKSVTISEDTEAQVSGERKSGDSGDGFAQSQGLSGVDPSDADATNIAMSASLDGGLAKLAAGGDADFSSSMEESKSIQGLPAATGPGEGPGEASKAPPVPLQRDSIAALEKTQERLADEESKIGLELSHIHKDDGRMLDIKEADRALYGRERSREIERKRRLLTKEEGVRKGNPPAEAQNAYDWYAKKCQSVIRGWLARCYHRWFKEASRKASTIIQATARGKLGRLRVKKRKEQSFAQTQISKIYRGYKARGVGAAMAANRNVGKSAIKIQRVFRGHRGRKRALSKKALDNATEVAREAVDPRALLASDVRELGRRIQLALEEPETTPYPPDEVLHLVRITTVILQQSRGVMGFSEYNYINARYYGEVDGEDLTWQGAANMLNRAERLIRLVRAMAFGPGEKPPRMIQISPQAQVLYAAQLANPRWKSVTFEQIGLGSKFCSQLFNWIISVTEVAERQQEFGSFLVSSFPDWLPTMFELEAKTRNAEFTIEVATRCIEKVKERYVQTDDAALTKLLQPSIKEQEQIIEEQEQEFVDLNKQIDDLCTSQVKREDVAILNLEQRLEIMHVESKEMTENYLTTNRLATNGDPNARNKLPELRSKMTEHELSMKSMESQLRLLKEQVVMNHTRRTASGALPIDIRVKATTIGEALAEKYLAIAKIGVFLGEQGVRHKEDLPDDLFYMWERLDQERVKQHKAHYAIFVDGDAVRKAFDRKIFDELAESQKQEIASAEKVRPSDEELEEERREDDEQAKKERLKRLQFIPDAAINHEHPDRPRPTVIALGRDLPQHAKQKIRQEVTKLMPGLFVFLDHEKNMGLDVLAMQAVLDAKKCIMMMVDQGSTRQSRTNFVKSFEVTLRALIPNPTVIMLVGDDKNSRGGTDHYGAAKSDLQGMRDREIKVSLEGMAWVTRQIETKEVQRVMSLRSKMVEPPSPSFVHVGEAFFCVQSNIDSIRLPDPNFIAMSWRFVSRLMSNPQKIVDSLRELKRGSTSLKFCQCVNEYTNNKLWPPARSKVRQDDPLLHMMALYVELFLVAEQATLDNGGMPVQVLSKGSRAGVQAMEVVQDTSDPEDTVYVPTSCGWRMTVAKVVKFALQDLRTMKKVMKINGTLLNVGAYRERDMLYFDTYNTKTSEQHICATSRDDVPFLLMPNAETLEVEGRSAPPKDKLELYQHLALLLHFDKMNRTTAGSRRVLRCSRNYTLLRKIQTKLDGHSVFIKCFEAALAQLYFKIYLQDTGAECTFLLEERARLEILQNADPTLELKHVQDDDARKMLALSIDRLVISPSKTMQKCAMGRLFDAHAYHKKGVNLNDVRAQGYKLKVRTHGGAGRKLCRRIVDFTGIPHLLEVRVFTLESLLLITAYEPRTRASLHLKLPLYLRKLLLDSSSDDYRVWIKQLTERLKINWRGNRSLFIDSTIHRSVRKVAGKRMLMKVQIEDEDHVKVIMIDTEISETFVSVLTKKHVVELLLYEQIGDVIKRDFGVEVDKAATRKILNDMARGPTSLPGEGRSTDNEQIDQKVFEIPLIDIMSNNAHVLRLTRQLELVVTRIKKDSEFFGYHCKAPVHLEFIPPRRSEHKESMNTDLRFTTALRQSERKGDLQGVLRARKQMIPNHMEEELNDLAFALLKAAEAKAEAEHLANEEFERQLLGIADGDAFAIKNPVDLGPSSGDEEGVEKKAEIAVAKEEEESGGVTETKSGAESPIGSKPGSRPTTSGTTPGMPGVHGGSLSAKEFEALSEEEQNTYRIENSAAVQESIQEAAKLAMADALGTIEESHQKRVIERSQPGNTQDVKRIDDEARRKHLAENPPAPVPAPPVRPIVGRHEKKIYEGGVKTTFKDTKNSWSGHVAINVYEIVAWAQEEGLGKKFKFDVYEPGTAQIYTGFIDDIKHLRRILGKHGKDLEHPSKVTEMILFVAKFRMWVVDNKVTWDGEINDPDAAPYRIEFETVRVYTEDKVTPINADAEVDAEANKNKLIEAQKRRGIKISRQVRRVNGVLMQLTTFEVATSPEHRAAIQDSVDLVEGEARAISVWEPPTLKIIGYNPRSKRKAIYIAPPAAILEVAGGVHSPFLDPKRRRELAKIAAEALALKFPKEGPPELIMAWSGSSKEFAAAASAVAKAGKVSRSSAEAVLKRTGKLFRTALVIGRVECVVTLFNQVVPSAQPGNGASGYQEKQLIVNIYSRAASEATEIVITDAEQVERIGRTIASFPDGEIRSAAVRRLIRFIHADIIPDMTSDDPDRKVLHVVLRAPRKDFLTEYGQVKPTPPGEDIRPVGVPAVFLPLDTQGTFLYRCSRALKNLKKPEDVPLDYIITAYTKSEKEGAERGIVIKFYERDTANTCILHLGPSEMMRICTDNDEPHLMKEMSVAVNKAEAEKQDALESAFESVTSKGELVNDANKVILKVVKMMLDDIGLTTGPDLSIIPYIISKGRGNIPIL